MLIKITRTPTTIIIVFVGIFLEIKAANRSSDYPTQYQTCNYIPMMNANNEKKGD